MAPHASGITDDLAVRLAEVAAQAFYQVLSLQRPWGEFRELIPQSIETLASRGREAEQYRFGPKPKIFVSFDAIRTFRRVLEAIGTPAPDPLNQRFEWAKTRLAEYVAISILTGVKPPSDVTVGECRWFPDYAFGDVNDHSGIHELNRVPDIRHTAEGVHFLLEYGGCDLDTFLLDKTAENPDRRKEFASRPPIHATAETTIHQLIESLILVVEDKAADDKFKFDRLSLIVIAHLLNLFVYVASIAPRDVLAARVRLALKKLANCIATDEHFRSAQLWKTDSLGDVWGASFLMHLFDCNPVPPALGDCWTKAAVEISARLDEDFVYPPNDDKMFETNIQALLALCKVSIKDHKPNPLSLRQIERLSQLVIQDGVLQTASLEIGEACQLVQLSLLLAKPETVTAITTSVHLLGASIRALVGALAEQLNYGFLSQHRADRLAEVTEGDAKHAYGYVVTDVIERCEGIRGSIVGMAADWPSFRLLVSDGTAVPENPQQALMFYHDILLKLVGFLGVGWVDAYVYPDLSGVQSFRKISVIPWDDHVGPLPRHFRRCIEQLWAHALDSVRQRAIGGGLSGARVFETGDLKCLPRIVKCGSKAEILSEVNRYKAFVEGRLPGAPSMCGPVHWGHTYAIAYENAESRAVPSRTSTNVNEYSKGRTLEEILDHVLTPYGQNRYHLLDLYGKALRRALQCLKSWEGQGHEAKRRLFSLGAEHEACFRLPFRRDYLMRMLHEAFGFAPNGGATELQNRIEELIEIPGEEVARLLSTSTIHGDFHARNVYVVLTMRPGPAEIVTEEMRRDFRPEHAHSVTNVAIIDFANVTDGEVRCLDYGKYLRDLRARSLSRALNRLGAVADEDKLGAMHRILAGSKDELKGMEKGIFLRVLEKTIEVFDECEKGWNRRALLYQELMFLYRLMQRKGKPWNEDMRKYFGGWSSWDLALRANVLGIQWAFHAVEVGTRRVH